jgi:hypothetical protein
MTSSSDTSYKKAMSVFKEDSVQIPTQKRRIICFHPDSLVKCSDNVAIPSRLLSMYRRFEQFKVASVLTLFRVREDSSVQMHPFV